MKKQFFVSFLCMFSISMFNCLAGDHPCLLFGSADVKVMKADMDQAQMFRKSLEEVLARADAALDISTEVPRPEGGDGTPVHAILAYDCVYDYIGARDRETIESRLFRPCLD